MPGASFLRLVQFRFVLAGSCCAPLVSALKRVPVGHWRSRRRGLRFWAIDPEFAAPLTAVVRGTNASARRDQLARDGAFAILDPDRARGLDRFKLGLLTGQSRPHEPSLLNALRALVDRQAADPTPALRPHNTHRF